MPFLVCVTVLHIYVSGESDIVFNSLNIVLLVIAASLLLMLLMILFLLIKEALNKSRHASYLHIFRLIARKICLRNLHIGFNQRFLNLILTWIEPA